MCVHDQFTLSCTLTRGLALFKRNVLVLLSRCKVMQLKLQGCSSLGALALFLIGQQESETTRVNLRYNLRLDSICIADVEIDLEES